MERRLKERLIGASVLVMAAVIFIPIILGDSSSTDTRITESNIPPRPESDFTSRIVPLPDARSGGAGTASQDEAPARPAPRGPAAPAPAATQAQAEEPPVSENGAVAPPPAPAVQAAAAPRDDPAPDSERVGMIAWVVQAGSFTSEENAAGLNRKLREAGYASFVERAGEGADLAYRVRIGPELLRSDAIAIRDRLKAKMELDGIVLRYP